MTSEQTARRPLSGRRIAVTRSVEDNRSLTEALQRLGAEVVAWPMMEVIEPADGGMALRAAVGRLAEYHLVTLTSVNGVVALAAALGDLPWPKGPVVVPVGPVTGAVAADHGMTVVPAPMVATAQALVDAVPAWAGAGTGMVLAPLAELAGDTLVDGLAAKGYVVDRVEAYRTVAVDVIDEPVAGVALDGLTLFSPSAVDRLVDRLEGRPLPDFVADGPVTVCIGPSTAARASDRGLSNIVVAEPHTEAGVVARLIEAIGKT